MLALLAPLLAVASLVQAEPAPDQTSDALLVTGFLQAVRTGDDAGAATALAENVRYEARAGAGPATLEAFAAYARACQLSRIDLVNSRSRTQMPVLVEWRCRYPEADRSAALWVEDGQIQRIGWGATPTVDLPAPISPPAR